MIAEIEDGMIARLKAAFGGQLPYRVKTIESYGGQVDIGDDGRPQASQAFATPAVFVTFARQRQTERMGERTAAQRLSYVIYCVTQNSRNERATRQGDQNNVGSFQLAEDVAQLLVNQTFGVQGIKPAVLDEIEVIFSPGRNDGAKAMSMMAVHVHMQYHMQASVSDCIALIPTETELRSIASGFYLQPDDGVADATAVVQIPA